MKFEAAIFDVEGTLIARRPGSEAAMLIEGLCAAHAVLSSAGLELPDLRTTVSLVQAEISRSAGGLAFGNHRELSIPGAVRGFLARAFPGAAGEAVDEALAAWYAPFASSARAMPGAKEALQAAKAAGLKTAAAGNSRWGGEFVATDLADCGLSGLLDATVCSADVGFRKPNLFLLLKTAGLLGVPPEKTIHVGDDLREDVDPPQELGMTAVIVGPPGKAHFADFEIPTLHEFGNLLARLPAS